MMMATWKQIGPYAVPGLFIIGLLAVLGLWLTGGSIPTMHEGVPGVLIAIGGLVGFLAFYLVLWQLLLIGRIGWIEPVYGHDRLSRWHHIDGLVAWGLIGLHPVLLISGYSLLNERNVVGQTTLFLTAYPYVWWAAIAYVMYLSIVFVSLTIVRRRLKYETWYLVHVLLYGAVILSFMHQLSVGLDLQSQARALFWWTMMLFVAANVLYYRFGQGTLKLWRHDFRVAHLEAETPNVTSVYIEGRDMVKFRSRAGQFVIVRFLAWPWVKEQHPFSLSQITGDGHLRLSVKAVGDFTQTVANVPVGIRVLVDGPFGRFTSELAHKERALFIAGGIGITPLRALFEEYAVAGRNVDLVYAARSEADLALRDELRALANGQARVHFVAEDTAGRLTPEKLREVAPDIAERDIFLCGPPPMMKAVREQLIGMGVPDDQIYYEKFELG